MRILVATNHLSVFAGGALVAVETACALRNFGHRIVLSSGYIAPPLEDRVKSLNLTYQSFEEVSSIYDYDLVWAQNYSFPALLASSPATTMPLPRIFAVCLSPYEPLEMPGAIVELADRIIVNSQETADNLFLYGIDPKRTYVFNNAAPAEFNLSRPPIRTLRSILAVANHAPAELEESFALIRDCGLTVNRVGIPHGQSVITPDLIRQHDAVVTIGKTVQYAVQGETPIYIYDRFGGPGWLLSTNVDAASYFNFSGRCCCRKLSAASIKDEIFDGHAKAAADILSIKSKFTETFNLDARLADILRPTKDAIVVDHTKIECVRREGVLAKIIPELYLSTERANRLRAQVDLLKKQIDGRALIIAKLSREKFQLSQLVDALQKKGS